MDGHIFSDLRSIQSQARYEASLRAVLAYERKLLELEQSASVKAWHSGDVPVWTLLKYSFVTYAYENQIALDHRPFFRTIRRAGFGLASRRLKQSFSRKQPNTPTLSKSTPEQSVWLTATNRFWHFADHAVLPGFDFLRNTDQDRPAVWLTNASDASALNAKYPWQGVKGISDDLHAVENLQKSETDLAFLNTPEGKHWLATTAAATKNAPHIIRLQVRRHIDATRRFKHYFKQTLVRHAVENVHIDAFGYELTVGLCLAARQCGVSVTEIQHGVTRLSDYILPQVGVSTSPDLPQNFLTIPSTYNLTGQTFLQRSLGFYETYFETSNPSLHNSLNALCVEVADLKEQANGQKIVLITHQSFDDLTWLDAALSRKDDTQYWLRTHRASDQQSGALKRIIRKWGRDPRLDVELPSQAPLDWLLSHADVHVTQYSSAALEAAARNVPTHFLLSGAREFPSYSTPNPNFVFPDTEDF